MTKSRGAFVLVVTVLVVVALELSLQAGAWLVRASGRAPALGWHTGDVRVLCLGDSNTYGLWVEADAAWPAVLQEHWNAGGHRRRVEVINLGFPGTTSTRLLKNLPGVLDTFKPDLVLVMVGVNDWWSPPVPTGGPGGGFALRAWLYDHVRLYRLVYMLQQRWAFDRDKLRVSDALRPHAGSPERPQQVVEELTRQRQELARRIREGQPVDDVRTPVPESLAAPIEYDGVTFDLGMSVEGNDSGEKPADTLARALTEMYATAERSPSRLVLMTYPSNTLVYDAANRVVRTVAGQLGAPLIDVTAGFVTGCGGTTTKGCERYFLPDQHPSPAGHGLLAERVADDLRDVLDE